MMPTEKIRLVEFLNNFNIGGTERQVVNLAMALDHSRFELHIACLGRSGQFLQDIRDHLTNFSEYPINSLHNHRTLAEQWRFARYVRNRGIQVVHAYGFYANVFSVPAARLGGARAVIASIRDTGDPLTAMQRRVQRAACSLADCILANSEAVRRNLLAEGYPAEKITVIRNGIALPLPGGDSGRLHRELGLPGDSRLVAVVSRLNPLKGIEYFLAAAARVAAEFENAYFLVVGDGIDPAYRGRLEDYTARLGMSRRVVFTGFRLDIPSILSGVSVSVLPSLSEGLSNVLLESMAAGIPVIATRVGGNPEVVEEGISGFLVPPRDDAALAEAVCRVLRDPGLAARLGAAGRRRAEEEFGIGRMVGETQRLYMRLLTTSFGRSRIQEAASA